MSWTLLSRRESLARQGRAPLSVAPHPPWVGGVTLNLDLLVSMNKLNITCMYGCVCLGEVVGGGCQFYDPRVDHKIESQFQNH